MRLVSRLAKLEGRMPAPKAASEEYWNRGHLPGSAERWAEHWKRSGVEPVLDAIIARKWPGAKEPPANWMSDDEVWAIVEPVYVPWDDHEREMKDRADQAKAAERMSR